MNQREAMQALLAGKRLTSDTLARPGYLELRSDGMLYWCSGKPAALATHVWEIYEEPNPHTPGTFNWAREEAKRDNTVCCPSVSKDYPFNYRSFQHTSTWALKYFDAADWEVVK